MQADQRWAQLAVETCVRLGATRFFLAPGSRCTPLTLAVAQHPDTEICQHFDERGLAFAAVGYGRATNCPAVFICTSGTAVANALPAVVEAFQDEVPLLLMTADRPPELRGVGANQSIDQVRLFGTYTRWSEDLPCPTDEIHQRFVVSQVDHALRMASTGPVHLNWMFREPFTINDEFEQPSVAVPSPPAFAHACDEMLSLPITDRTLMVIGSCDLTTASSASRLAEEFDLPLLTDITCSWRGNSTSLPGPFALPRPDTILHVGGRVVSKAWNNYVASLERPRIFHLTRQDGRVNPYHHPVEPIQLRGHRPLHESVDLVRRSTKGVAGFRAAWDEAQRSREAVIAEHLEPASVLCEPVIARAIGNLLPEASRLFLGNSSPVRDFDWFAHWEPSRRVAVGANRGASGIDGLIATAFGFSLDGPLTAVIGDLAALHDLNSLALFHHFPSPATLIVLNNHGGGIFDMLPVATQTAQFEQFFATPHAFGFAPAAAMFGLPYHQPESLAEFASLYQDAMNTPGLTILEVVTRREENLAWRRRIESALT